MWRKCWTISAERTPNCKESNNKNRILLIASDLLKYYSSLSRDFFFKLFHHFVSLKNTNASDIHREIIAISLNFIKSEENYMYQCEVKFDLFRN